MAQISQTMCAHHIWNLSSWSSYIAIVKHHLFHEHIFVKHLIALLILAAGLNIESYSLSAVFNKLPKTSYKKMAGILPNSSHEYGRNG